MSYCPHCDDNVELIEKKNMSKSAAKGFLGATTAAVDMFSSFHDKSEYEVDKSQLSRYEAEKRNYERQRQSQTLSNLSKGFNNKLVDMAIPDDHYLACESCGSEVSFPQCESRPEYLGMSYDDATARSSVFFASTTFFATAAILQTLMPTSPTLLLISLAVGAISFFSIRFVPFKPRGILNLISENLSTFFFGLFIASVVSLLVLLGIDALIENVIVKNILAIVFMGGIVGGSVYSVFLKNKQRWGEIKETWKLMDELNELEAQEAQEENIDKDAA